MGLQVNPTFNRDIIQSVTLQAFRKIIGFDTFNSILKKDRDETKDPADYYNVTVNMLVKREPAPKQAHEIWHNEDGKTLKQVIDKGFPYDDADSTSNDRAPLTLKKNAHSTVGEIVGKLNGLNYTEEQIRNLVTDKVQPVTQELMQVKNTTKAKNDDKKKEGITS